MQPLAPGIGSRGGHLDFLWQNCLGMLSQGTGGSPPEKKVICWRIFCDGGEQELSILVTNIAMLFIIAAILLLKFDYHNDNCNVNDD